MEARRGNSKDAERAYREALRISPDDRDAMNNLAWLLLSEHRNLAESEMLARRASAVVGPDSFLYLDTLAHVLRARGKCTEAATTFQSALDSTPSTSRSYQPATLLGLAQAQRDCGQMAQARETLQQALAAAPDASTRSRIESELHDLATDR